MAQRDLQLGLQDGERRAQLVARVRHERSLLGERVIEAREHGVERLPEA